VKRIFIFIVAVLIAMQANGSMPKDCPMMKHHNEAVPAPEATPVGEKDKCPVCGMFVAKYPGFLAQIRFKDGGIAFFDGPKDFFTYYLALNKYNPKKKISDIEAAFVTNYYTQSPINALTALYVVGSDITGPMGKELVPFKTAGEAADFKKDHKGTRLLLFNDVTAEVLKDLDK
jgi:nitrous oxide reductase accessory protein NosL